MEWNTVIIAVISGGLISSGIAYFANRNFTTAGTFEKLTGSLNSLSDDLEQERKSRKQDKEDFQIEIDNLKALYEEKLTALENRVSELELERNELLLENRRLSKLIQGG